MQSKICSLSPSAAALERTWGPKSFRHSYIFPWSRACFETVTSLRPGLRYKVVNTAMLVRGVRKKNAPPRRCRYAGKTPSVDTAIRTNVGWPSNYWGATTEWFCQRSWCPSGRGISKRPGKRSVCIYCVYTKGLDEYSCSGGVCAGQTSPSSSRGNSRGCVFNHLSLFRLKSTLHHHASLSTSSWSVVLETYLYVHVALDFVQIFVGCGAFWNTLTPMSFNYIRWIYVHDTVCCCTP